MKRKSRLWWGQQFARSVFGVMGVAAAFAPLAGLSDVWRITAYTLACAAINFDILFLRRGMGAYFDEEFDLLVADYSGLADDIDASVVIEPIFGNVPLVPLDAPLGKLRVLEQKVHASLGEDRGKKARRLMYKHLFWYNFFLAVPVMIAPQLKDGGVPALAFVVAAACLREYYTRFSQVTVLTVKK